MSGYKHYIRKDADGIVYDGYADWQTELRATDEIQLNGDFGRQFQFNIYTDRLQFKYKIVNGQMIERTQAELDTELATRPAPPKTPDQKKIDELTAEKEQMNLSIIELWENIIPLLP